MPRPFKEELDAARLKHVLFKSKLRSYLYGSGIDDAPIRDPRVCALGQWIEQIGRPQFRHLPEMQQLDELHEEMHREANRLLDLYGAGRRDEAVAGLSGVNRLADMLTDLLDTLEAKLRTEGR
ncbi:hypothetical protein F0P96_05505 [Hymenobacter busanensis]|uniref:Uncharacterized protein n=1 Tax=Hymenobacter busanensis TaxID=2607656 RepID=A0A7L5A1C6_9BACT|nr:CZB domain-containing protein [Hymenobacter busanensis]KAA9338295.1 hypothetical protein F0P96_05505 [Hymenobacter busanensis]QHJ09281.1 hypothetical protein GUY19_19105 [Hymenobacter busanensis]